MAMILCIPVTGSAQVLLSTTEFAILGGTAKVLSEWQVGVAINF